MGRREGSCCHACLSPVVLPRMVSVRFSGLLAIDNERVGTGIIGPDPKNPLGAEWRLHRESDVPMTAEYKVGTPLRV